MESSDAARRADTHEERISHLERVLADDDRLATGVERLADDTQRVERLLREIPVLAERTTRTDAKVDEEKRTREQELRIAQAIARTDRKRLQLLAAVGLVVTLAFGGLLWKMHQESEERLRTSHQGCLNANARADATATLVRDLTAQAGPEAKARIEQVLGEFLSRKTDCDIAYPLPR